MPSQPKPSAHLAVLIDAENASSKIAEALFTEIAKLGVAAGRRIYGDFSSASLKGWTEVLARWALQPQQNFANTRGKNSGDIALVIDAMDLLHSGRFDGFCLVSSDSDFTRLAARIREQGVPVYGFGERQDPGELPAGLHPVHLHRESHLRADRGRAECAVAHRQGSRC